MKTRQRPLSLFIKTCSCGLIAGAASTVFAETGSPQRPVAIEEVIVTAQKRIENIQEVPKSVDVKSQEDFSKAGVTQITELSAVVPSVTTTAPGTSVGSAPGIRGVKTITTSVGVQSKTGVLVDEVAQPTFSTLPNSLIDIERIEVFSGPQSTLSGRNAAAGLISITTRAPSHTPELNLGVTITDDDQRRVTAFGTAPINDELAFSLSGYSDHQNGQTYSPLENGKYIGAAANEGGRAKLLWEPTAALSATLSAYYVESHREIGAALASGDNGFDYVDPSRASFVASLFPLWNGKSFTQEIYSPTHGNQTTRDRGASVHVDYDIDRLGTFTSLTNYQKSDQSQTVVLLGAQAQVQAAFPGPIDFNQYSQIQNKYFSQEFRLVSEDMDPWTYLIGALYSHSETDNPVQRPFQLFGVVDNTKGSDIKSTALFGRVTYSLTDEDSLTGGLRYQYDKSAYSEQDNYDNPADTTPAGRAGYFSGDSSYGFWAGEVSFKHDFSYDMNAYITLALGETGEAYDLENQEQLKTTGLDPLASEKVKNIEIGLKSHLFDDRMTFNIAAFLAKYTDYQMQSLDTTDPTNLAPTIKTFSIGKVETRGIELSSSFQASAPLRFDVNAALLDAKITSYPNAPCYASYQTAAQGCDRSGSATGVQDLSGATMPETPRWKYTVAADYMVFLPSLPFDGDLGAFYRYQASEHFDTFDDPYTKQDGFGTLNLYAALISRDDKYRIKLFVNNALDKHYYNNLRKDQFLGSAAGPVIDVGTDRNAFRYAGISFDAKFK